MLASTPAFRTNARLFLATAIACAAACAPSPGGTPVPRPGGSLPAFRDAAELEAYHAALVEESLRQPVLGSVPATIKFPPPPGPDGVVPPPPAPEPEPPPPPPPPLPLGDPVVREAGDHLVVFRRGALYTVRVGGGALERVDSVAALGLADSLETTEVHEVFVADGGVQVIAHDSRASEARLAFFRLGADGRLAYRYGYRLRAGPSLYNGEHRVRSVGGGQLAFYDRIVIPRTGDTRVAAALPALRREGAPASAARPLVGPGRLHRPAFPVEWYHDPVLHAATLCEPGEDGLECRATALYASKGEIAHLSSGAAYVWGPHARPVEEEEESYDPDPRVLYRLPLDGAPAAAVQVSGNPRDDRSITETGDGHVSVFVLHDGWTRASHSRSPVPALLRVAPGDFGDGRGTVPRARFRMVPNFPGPRHNRFVGDWLAYGNRPLDAYAASTGLFQPVRPGELGVGALRADGGGAPAWLPVGRGVEGLAPAGERAALVLCSCRDALQVALLRLGEAPRLTGWVPRAGVGHWEGAVLGVAYREDGPDAGLVGLPVGFSPEPFFWRATTAAFFRHDGDTLRSFGELRVRGDPAGNRDVVPFFAHGRVFALLGGDLVEAAEEGDRLREARRITLP